MTAAVSLNSQPLVATRDNGLRALHAELERAFAFFNARWWSGALPLPLFAFFAQSPRTRRLGHYRARSWREPDGSARDEIVLYADLALSLGLDAVLETLLHEMVHVWQEYFDRPSVRHNAAWHAEAARVGLTTWGDKGYTSAAEGFRQALAELGPRVDGIPFRLLDTPRSKAKLAKWICACGYGVRVAVPHFDATCHRCGERFRLAGSPPPLDGFQHHPVESFDPEGDES
jgi:hypothetical protein